MPALSSPIVQNNLTDWHIGSFEGDIDGQRIELRVTIDNVSNDREKYVVTVTPSSVIMEWPPRFTTIAQNNTTAFPNLVAQLSLDIDRSYDVLTSVEPSDRRTRHGRSQREEQGCAPHPGPHS